MTEQWVIYRPGVAGAVLQTPLLLINSISKSSSSSKSSKHYYSQPVRPRDLESRDNVHHPMYIMCHISCVICHVSCLTCHMSREIITFKLLKLVTWNLTQCSSSPMCWMSRVLCSMSHVMLKRRRRKKVIANQWRVCYQRGLPHLIFSQKWLLMGVVFF